MNRALLICYGIGLFGARYQRDLAEALGVNERTVRRWIAGDTDPPTTIRPELDGLVRQKIKALETILRLK